MYNNWEFFPKRLKELRQKLNLTQEAMGYHVFLSRSCIANYERGFRYPDLQTLNLIARAYNVEIGYFFC